MARTTTTIIETLSAILVRYIPIQVMWPLRTILDRKVAPVDTALQLVVCSEDVPIPWAMGFLFNVALPRSGILELCRASNSLCFYDLSRVRIVNGIGSPCGEYVLSRETDHTFSAAALVEIPGCT